MPFKPKTHAQLMYKPPIDNRPSAAVRGYGTRWHKYIRPQVLLRDNYTCQVCGLLTANKNALHIDHITPKSKGGTDDISNLQTLCASCHSVKTARHDGGFGYTKADIEEAEYQTEKYKTDRGR